MSKLIDALNRLQSFKDEGPIVIVNPSDPAALTVSPSSPNSGACSTVATKKTSARKSVEAERPLFNPEMNNAADLESYCNYPLFRCANATSLPGIFEEYHAQA